MNFQVGDLLQYEEKLHAKPFIKHCIVLEAGYGSGIVYWFSGVDKEFKQHVKWISIYGTYRKL